VIAREYRTDARGWGSDETGESGGKARSLLGGIAEATAAWPSPRL